MVNDLSDRDLITYFKSCNSSVKKADSEDQRSFFEKESISAWLEIERREIAALL